MREVLGFTRVGNEVEELGGGWAPEDEVFDEFPAAIEEGAPDGDCFRRFAGVDVGVEGVVVEGLGLI